MLSASELELYDRQIRVWGIEAQRRLRQLSICVVSSSLASTGLAFETLKNLCLAGVASVTFIPCPSSHPRPAQVANEDTKEGDITEEVTRATGDSIEEVTRATGDSIEEVTRATGASLESILRGLNPAVRVEVSKRYTSVSALEAAKGIDFWSEFDCVVSVGLDLEEAVRINEGCRKGCRSKGTAFFSAHPFGFQAVVFADLVEYQYVLKKDSGAETFLETYSSLKEALDEVDPIKFGQLMKKRSLKKAVKIWLTFIVASEIRKHNIGVAEGIALVERKYGIGTALILEDEVSSLVSCWNIEFSPVCSIVGGLLAQEILKSATKDSHPLKNFVVFDGLTTAACVLDISPEPSPRPHLKRKL